MTGSLHTNPRSDIEIARARTLRPIGEIAETAGIAKSKVRPSTAMPSSIAANVRSGRGDGRTHRANRRLPTQVPPMNVASSTPRDAAEEPITRPSS